MSVTIDYTQVRTVEEGPLYKVVTTVSYVENIAPEIFVYNVESDTYEHVATVWDMEHVITSRSQAQIDGLRYYRRSNCTVEYPAQSTALAFVDYVKDRVEDLALQYARATENFEGTVNVHVVGTP